MERDGDRAPGEVLLDQERVARVVLDQQDLDRGELGSGHAVRTCHRAGGTGECVTRPPGTAEST